MGDKLRWRYGDTNPVRAAVDSATVIEIGDLLWLDTDDAKPAAMLAAIGALLAPEVKVESFARKFLGVAMQWSRSDEATAVRVATTGVFEFDCPNGTFELGDLIGADHCHGLVPDTEPHLLDQQVTKVEDVQYAIGRVAKREPSPVTSVMVDIRSRVMTNGVLG